VAGVSRVLFELGGNIEDASMTRLGGEFTMMLVTALPASAASLDKRLKTLAKKEGLQIAVKPIAVAVAHRPRNEPPKYLVSVYGTDHPGIVAQIAQALADHKVSITDLQTKVTGSAQKPVYVMLLEFQAPASLDMEGLRSELDQLRQDLKVEISLQDIEAVPL